MVTNKIYNLIDVLKAMSRETVFLFLSLMGDQDSLKIANNLYLNSKDVPIPQTLKKAVCNSNYIFDKLN